VGFTGWYHAEALELEESKLFSVLGFKCCRCRKIKSPVCPYSDLVRKEQVVEQSGSRASKGKRSGADSSSETLADIRACEPASPVFPSEAVSKPENNPPPFPLSDVELITEPELDAGFERNTISGSGLQKIPTTRHFKPEGDNSSSFGGEVWHAEISTQDEMGNLPAEVLSPFIEDDFVFADCNLLSDFDIVDSELLHLDSSSHFEEADAFGDLSGFVNNSCTLGVPEESATTSLQNNQRPTISSNDNVHICWQCSQTEPAPDLSCQICGMWIHSKCSPWIESSSMIGDWKCGNCREWQ